MKEGKERIEPKHEDRRKIINTKVEIQSHREQEKRVHSMRAQIDALQHSHASS